MDGRKKLIILLRRVKKQISFDEVIMTYKGSNSNSQTSLKIYFKCFSDVKGMIFCKIDQIFSF